MVTLQLSSASSMLVEYASSRRKETTNTCHNSSSIVCMFGREEIVNLGIGMRTG